MAEGLKNRLIRKAHRDYPLDEVVERDEPNLYREIFPYGQVCRVPFDGVLLAPDPPQEIWITDTTFRDGQQARAPYSPEQIVSIFKLLHRLGGQKGIIRQTEFFLYSDKDKEAVEKCQELGYRYPEITSWIRAVKEDFKLVKAMGLRETGILTSVSDYHIYLKLGKKRRDAFRDYLEVVEAALAEGVIPRCHFEDITRADIYGFVVPFARALMEASRGSGLPVKIRLCDTMGYGVPHPGAALPRSVPRLVRAMIEDAGVPSEALEWHGHNDFHKVLINGSTAWLYGCAAVNGTLLGFGERTGNPPIEGLVIEYMELTGTDDGMDATAITDMRNYFERELDFTIPPWMPFVGSDFNTTKAGIHIDGILKNEEIYNIFDTTKILNRPMGVAVTDKSGVAGIAHWVNTHFALTGDAKVDKRHPGIAKVYRSVTRGYESGRSTPMSNEEMERKVRRYMPELFVSEYDKLKNRIRETVTHILEGIVENPDIRSLDSELMERVMRDAAEEHPFIQFIYATDSEGRKITKNITQIEDKPKYADYEVYDNYSDRSWFQEPVKTGKVSISNIYTSKVTGRLTLTVSAPVYDMEERMGGVLAIDIKFEELARLEDGEEPAT
ncbi:MAG: histone-lysine N-methyltransferase [Deltaproteobacteria bacterium]|nr:histone-lysine N-methyltransferase [Deltaproteobacteria bacterium]